MYALCGNPGLVHDGPGAPPSADGGSPGGSYAQPTPDIIETADAANGTGTTYNASVNQVIRGQLGSATDHDWYRVNLVAGQTYTFALVGTGTNDLRDPELFLRDGNGNLITSNDDGGPGLSSTITYTATATGTYYLDAAAWNSSGSGQYGLSITQGNRAHYDLAMGGGAIDADFSWSATPGTGATVTYGFRQSEPPYSVQGSATQATFSQLTAQEIAAVQLALQLWSDVANITFTQVNPGGYTDNATILFSNYADPNDGAGAFAFYPGSTASTDPAGDVYLNTTSVSTSSLPLGSYSAFAIMHEIGHTLGLSHPGDYNAAPGQTITYANNAQFIEDSQQYSVMSYFDDGNTGGNAGSYPDTPLLLDVYAAQQIYGPNMTTRTGDTVYGFGSNAGAVYDFAINSDPLLCIWDAGGTDTLNCSGFSQNQVINLTAGLLSDIGGFTGNVSIALEATIETAVGGSGADAIYGNSANNTLFGGGSIDTFNGVSGLDMLFGGAGGDKFVFDNFAYSDATAVMPVVDYIDDYDRGNSGAYSAAEGDQIDLSELLFGALGGGQAVGAFVRVVENGDSTGAFVQVDVDGTGNASHWVTIAELENIHLGNTVNVILNSSQPAGVTLTLQGDYGFGGDFNGDGKSDVLWRNDNGAVNIWQMNGAQLQSSQFVASAGSDWHIVGMGDFNGDGKSDVLWRNDNGAVNIWQMNGAQLQSSQFVASAGGDWHIVGMGDFNGDGKSDVLWRNDNGAVNIWQMNGAQLQSSQFVASAGSDWHIVGMGDFNGDGKSDVLWRNDNGAVNIWQMNGAQLQSSQFVASAGGDWHIVGSGDFNGDGKSDVLWRNDNGAVNIWQMNGAQLQSSQFVASAGSDWHIVGSGDFNGDGKSDVLWRNDNGAVNIWQMNGAQLQSSQFVASAGFEWQTVTHHYDLV